jgi:hypothetical protein
MITPGPWTIFDQHELCPTLGTERSIEIHGNDRWIAEVHGTHVGEVDDAINIANARAMAAVPEMIEALKLFVSNAEHPEGCEENTYNNQPCNCGLQSALAALEKAGVKP